MVGAIGSLDRRIRKLIEGTRHMAQGEYDYRVDVDGDDEIGHLAEAINEMGKAIAEKQDQLNKQRDEYQILFEETPCYITVQDTNLKLIRYNRQFADKFSPEAGEYCYQAYKGRSERCVVCPVMKTFEDGKPHFSEEAGLSKNGKKSHWLVRTSPLKASTGEVVAVMEMCLDITHMKFLEKEVEKSEQKYRSIFNTIPNPVFVLGRENLEILDCNDSVKAVYGFEKEELLGKLFLDLFEKEDRDRYAAEMRCACVINTARQIRKDGMGIYVNIRISCSEYAGRPIILTTTSDITKRLMAEQQLIQASKMSTLGEMATGVAHELNQPLSVIKTASSFFIRKIRKGEPIEGKVIKTLAEEIDSHVDRASKIISHMREFGRKSDVLKEKVQVNEPLRKAVEIFRQQLRLRQIEVVEQLGEDLPLILADPNRLEQVFVNLLINARDAIEEKLAQGNHKGEEKRISLKTTHESGTVLIEIRDTGTGIPEPILDKIFEPFFTTKKVGKGTGLGLSISYGIVQDYEGKIRVKTRQGEGSSFIVEFPAADGN